MLIDRTEEPQQRVIDQAHSRKYWVQVPNLLDDSDLDPFARTIYLHYLRIAGQRDSCEETVRETAAHCRMSQASVIKARDELEHTGWLAVEKIIESGRSAQLRIVLIDRWPENMMRYCQPSVAVVNARHTSVLANERSSHEQNAQPASVNARHTSNSTDPNLLTGEKTGEDLTPLPPKGAEPSKSNKSAAFIDSVRAAGLDPILTKADHALIKACPRPAEVLGAAYIAASSGRWGGDWLRDNLSLRLVVSRLGGYEAWRAAGGRHTQSNGHSVLDDQDREDLRTGIVIGEDGSYSKVV